MGATEYAVDAAARFLGPFVVKDSQQSANTASDTGVLVQEALSHLEAINAADLVADPNAPYDASLAGVVYGLLDIITLLGIVPQLSPGVAFSQRPKSVLTADIIRTPHKDQYLLPKVVQVLIHILEQRGTGVQPLLSQRILPDIITALAELSFSPASDSQAACKVIEIYRNVVSELPTSRLLPILTTLLQQPLPPWLRSEISYELSVVPLRAQGVRHIIEFLSLSLLSKNSQMPQDATGSQSQIPIPLEAIAQTSRLLVLPPRGLSLTEWLHKLKPQLLDLLDGNSGKEYIHAAGQIIAGGFLSKKATGAPGTAGWDLFALPLFQTIYPKKLEDTGGRQKVETEIVVQESILRSSLKRLLAIVSSYTHAGLVRRLVGPLLLPLWALLNHARARPLLEKEWASLPEAILFRYMAIVCDAKQVDSIASNLFWDGGAAWVFGPGPSGGIEIRRRREDSRGLDTMNIFLSRIGTLDTKVQLLVSLLVNASIPDDAAGSIFVQVTNRWLLPAQNKMSLTSDTDLDPLSTLIDAKLSQALATSFKDQFARSPQYVIQLMGQLIWNFVSEHKAKVTKQSKTDNPSQAMLENIVAKTPTNLAETGTIYEESADENLITFALSILSTLTSSPRYKPTPNTTATLKSIMPALAYLSQLGDLVSVSPLIGNSASALIHIINPLSSPGCPTNVSTIDPLSKHRDTLKASLLDLTSPDPPMRTWALSQLRKIVQDPTAFTVVDVPSLTHTLMAASLADAESYVYTAAIPVLVDLAMRAPNPVVGIVTDAFMDTDEKSLKLRKGRQVEGKDEELRSALDFRLRVGEVLHSFVLESGFWFDLHGDAASRFKSTRQVIKACLFMASRRGQRIQTHSTRLEAAQAGQVLQEEGEMAWGGPIPNLFEPDLEPAHNPAERDTLSKVVQGWEDDGVEEDVRIRTSALSVLSTLLEHCQAFVDQVMVDASLQLVLMILALETSEAKSILRRAGVLVILGLIRGLDTALEDDREGTVGPGLYQQEADVERVVKWVSDEDVDALTRDHAASVVESLETLRMKKLYRIRDDGLKLGPSLQIEGTLRGLHVTPNLGSHGERKKMIVEEIE